jgi:putative protease
MNHSLFEDMAYRAQAKAKEFYLALPLVCRLSVYNRLKKEIKEIIYNESVTGFLIKNYEEFALLQSLMKDSGCKKEIILNHNMYIFNKEAKEFWKDRGITHFTAPVELNYQELRNLGVEDCDLLVYGYLPLMISAQCLLENTTGCRKSGLNNTGYLTDRLGKKFLVQTNCSGCYNTIYNGQPLALHKLDAEIKMLKPDNIRLDFSFESGKQTEQIIASFVNAFRYGIKNMEVLKDYTTGHFKRGAL